mgnify:CR=1 FL=1
MKALALLSGGLDSIIAAKLIQKMGIEVETVHFANPFHQSLNENLHQIRLLASNLNVTLNILQFGEEFLRIIERPRYNYGKHMNPCVDCRIYQLKKAKKLMEEVGASFLITGEVLDQRAHSQRRDALDIVERDLDLRGLVLRPLSAKHLRPTLPEEKGWVDRDQLLDIKGRGRDQQIKLAQDFGISDFPSPAGGCLLTYREYSEKVKDLLKFEKGLSLRAVSLLQTGRHLRLSSQVKIIVGKNEAENNLLNSIASENEIILELADYQGPTTLYSGPLSNQTLELAAAITAGYSKAPTDEKTRVFAIRDGFRTTLQVFPMDRAAIKKYFIQHL